MRGNHLLFFSEIHFSVIIPLPPVLSRRETDIDMMVIDRMIILEFLSEKQIHSTGKSLSEALIFVSINPQYDNRLFMELP